MRVIRFCAVMLTAALVLTGCSPSENGSNNNDNSANNNTNGNDDDPMAFAVVAGDGFDGTTRTGRSVGTQEVAICGGFFPEAPNHQMTVNTSQTIVLSATGDDVLLWVLCGQSNFCGDEVNNAQEIMRFWTRGDCDVYVGSPEEGAEVDYTLNFTGP